MTGDNMATVDAVCAQPMHHAWALGCCVWIRMASVHISTVISITTAQDDARP